MTNEELADLYLLEYETGEQRDMRAFDEVTRLVLREPDRGWEVTRLLIAKATSDEALAYVAAGPLEDLLKNNGMAVMDRVEAEARANDRLQVALSGVWGLEKTPVHERWLALMREFGFADGKRKKL